MASTPSATLKWLLPVPGGPTRCKTSVRSMNLSSASAMMRFLSSEGWKEKSKLASVLMVESRAMTSAVLTRRFSRKVSSSASRASMASSAVISPRSRSAHGRVEDLDRAWHLEADHGVLDAVDHGRNDLRMARHWVPP